MSEDLQHRQTCRVAGVAGSDVLPGLTIAVVGFRGERRVIANRAYPFRRAVEEGRDSSLVALSSARSARSPVVPVAAKGRSLCDTNGDTASACSKVMPVAGLRECHAPYPPPTYDGSVILTIHRESPVIQVRVAGIALDAAQQHIVLLKPVQEGDGDRVLPIWIGGQEASSILIAISGESAPRPLTHDLMKMLIDHVGATVERIEVTRIEDGTFYAELSLTTPTGPLVLDVRPSDAVALAARTEAPLFVAEEVLKEAGIPAAFAELTEAGSDSDEKLAEFRKFLEDVNPEDFQG